MKRCTVVPLRAVFACMPIALAAVLPAVAQAEVSLPEFTVETGFKADFGKSKLNTPGAELTSTEGVINDVKPINKRTENALLWLLNASLGGGSCTSLGDATGNVLIPIETHWVAPGTLGLLKFKATHIDCTFLSTLILWLSGSTLLGKLSPAKVATNKFTLEINAPSKKQELTEYENNAGEKVKVGLKLGIDSETENATGSFEAEPIHITTEKETALVEREGEAADPLPEFTVETNFEGSFGKSKLNASGAEWTSTEGVIDQVEPIGKRLGNAVLWFKKAKLAGLECHSAGDSAENMLIPVEYHVLAPFTSPTTRVAFFIKETEVKCKFLGTTILYKAGSVLVGKLASTGTKTTKFSIEINAPGKKQELTEYENNAGEKVKVGLKLGIDSEKENGTGSQESEKMSVTTEEATELIES